MDEPTSSFPTDNTVYVRPVSAIELPDEVREKIADSETLYAVHNSVGQRLALVSDRKIAFALARRNDLAPVSVH